MPNTTKAAQSAEKLAKRKMRPRTKAIVATASTVGALAVAGLGIWSAKKNKGVKKQQAAQIEMSTIARSGPPLSGGRKKPVAKRK